MRITVLRSNVVVPEGKKYKVCELGYKTEDGKVKGMKIFGFGDYKEVFDVAAKATNGDVLEANFRQNDKGFWEFNELTNTGERMAETAETKASGKSTTGAMMGASARGNWETSDERAARQVMIVRQSSLSNAIAMVAANNPKGAGVQADVVIGIAKVFEEYVLDKPTVTGEVQ